MSTPKPQLFQFLSVTDYLEKIYAFKKSQSSGFSYDSWAAALGFKSRSFLKMIVTGQRNITLQFIDVFSADMQFSPLEKTYFSLLASLSQSGDEEEKNYYHNRLLEIRGQTKEVIEVSNYTEFLSSKILPQLLVLLSFDDVDRSEKGLSAFFNCSLEQMHLNLQTLEKMNLAQKQENDWIATTKSFKIPKNLGCQALENYHNNSLYEAIHAQKLPSDQRQFRSVLVPLSKTDYANLLRDIETLVSTTLAKYDSDKLLDKNLYKLNLNLIPSVLNPTVTSNENLVMISDLRTQLDF